MKKFTLLKFLGFGLILAGISCNPQPRNKDQDTVATSSADSASVPSKPASTLQIHFPKEGEKLIKEETYTLKWEGGGEKVSIFLIDSSLESAGASVSISDRVYEIANTGNYEYKIPENLEDGKYKFSIGDSSSPYFEIHSR